MGNFLSDIIREATNTDIAMINTYSVMYDHRWHYDENGEKYKIIPEGNISMNMAKEIYGFPNHIVKFKILGKDIKKILNHNGKKEFLHFSGIRFTYWLKKDYKLSVSGDNFSLVSDIYIGYKAN